MDAWIGNPELHGDELIWKSAPKRAPDDRQCCARRANRSSRMGAFGW